MLQAWIVLAREKHGNRAWLYGASDKLQRRAHSWGAFGRASPGSALRTKPEALPNGLGKQLPWRSSSGTPSLEQLDRGGYKNWLPHGSRGSSPPFASPAHSGVHRGTTVLGAREDGWRL
jgi:hypothetical protein